MGLIGTGTEDYAGSGWGLGPFSNLYGPNLDDMKRGERGMFERQDDWAAVAYFYLDRADDMLPAIESPEKRMKNMSWSGPVFGQTQ